MHRTLLLRQVYPEWVGFYLSENAPKDKDLCKHPSVLPYLARPMHIPPPGCRICGDPVHKGQTPVVLYATQPAFGGNPPILRLSTCRSAMKGPPFPVHSARLCAGCVPFRSLAASPTHRCGGIAGAARRHDNGTGLRSVPDAIPTDLRQRSAVRAAPVPSLSSSGRPRAHWGSGEGGSDVGTGLLCAPRGAWGVRVALRGGSGGAASRKRCSLA